MAFNNAYAAYANNKVMTASPAELTLMLYDGAIKFCNIGIVALENGEIEKAYINIIKVQRIIEEFQATLNHKYKVAEDFDKSYESIMKLLVQANMKKDKVLLEGALENLRTMRDTWKEVMRMTNNGSKVS